QVDALEKVLLDGESGKEPPTLRDVKDAGSDNLFRLSVREIPFAKVDRAGLRPHQLRQSAEQRGLSGAVGAHERDDLSPAHLERDFPENLHASVSRGKVFDFEKRLRGSRYFELSKLPSGRQRTHTPRRPRPLGKSFPEIGFDD